jgi:multiple sugar transport system substrate-binding protein
MRWVLDSPVAAEAYRRFSGWVSGERIAVAVGSPEWNAVTAAYPGLNPFQAGRAAFHFRSVNDVYGNQGKIGSNFEWDVLPVPRQGARTGVAVTSGHPNSAWSRTRYPDQAYDFLKFLAGPEAQEHLGRLHLSMPALKAKQSSYLDPQPVPHAQVFMDVFKRPRGMHFRHHTVLENWAQYSAAIRPIVVGERPLAEGLRELTRQMNDTVKYGSCAPYKGMTHPLPAEK